jgi:diketogulonate reductase-like aldo/keto reductase
LLAIAKKYEKTAAQVLIRWGLQHGFVEIPKSAKKQRIEENARVWDFEINEGDMQALDDMDEYLVTGIAIASGVDDRLGSNWHRMIAKGIWHHLG